MAASTEPLLSAAKRAEQGVVQLDGEDFVTMDDAKRDADLRRAVTFAWICLIIYVVSAPAWIFIQMRHGRTYYSMLFDPLFIYATASTLAIIFGVKYLSWKIRRGSKQSED